MPQVLMVADDLTGAADTGVVFGQAGLVTTVVLRTEAAAARAQAADVLVVSTESRQASASVAVERVRLAARLAPEAAVVYKKMDSTLRGHPAAELNALVQERGCNRILVAPAFPAQGRTTVGSVQLLHGERLESTLFAAEVPSADLTQIFAAGALPVCPVPLAAVRAGPGAVAHTLAGRERALFIADAETDPDLAILAAAAHLAGLRTFCGSAGLARWLPGALRLQPAVPRPSELPRRNGPILIVAGSRNPRTLCQIDVARDGGAAVVTLPQAYLDGAQTVGDAAARVLLAFSRADTVILTTAGLPTSHLSPEGVAMRLAAVAARLAESIVLGGVIMTGGDVAAATCAALGAATIHLSGEVEQGIAAGVLGDGPHAGLPVITKGGGFGSDRAFVAARHHLAGRL